jgi:hypothetical protein
MKELSFNTTDLTDSEFQFVVPDNRTLCFHITHTRHTAVCRV